MDLGDGSNDDGKVKLRKVGENKATYQSLSETELLSKINELEGQMFELAKQLEFEQAASLRDEIEALRRQLKSA